MAPTCRGRPIYKSLDTHGSLLSWAQTHPFMVTSWSPEKQDVLELFIQPRRGLTETIHHRTALDNYTSLAAFFSGPLLNSLLTDDILNDGYADWLFLFRHTRADNVIQILEMSFFVASNQMIEHGRPFGQHRRATLFNGKPRYEEIVSEEASGRNIKRLPNIHEDRGKVLVMGKSITLNNKLDATSLVPASHDIRDRLRIRKHFGQRVRLHETEFQPS